MAGPSVSMGYICRTLASSLAVTKVLSSSNTTAEAFAIPVWTVTGGAVSPQAPPSPRNVVTRQKRLKPAGVFMVLIFSINRLAVKDRSQPWRMPFHFLP